MRAVVVVFTADHSLHQIIGPFDTVQEAADHSATVGSEFLRAIAALTPPLPPEPCPFTHSHTRAWCGHPGCRES